MTEGDDMQRKIGLVMIFLGFAQFVYFGVDWWQQRQAIQQMSDEELNQYLGYEDTYHEGIQIKNSNESNGKPHVQMGEEIGELHIPTIKNKYPIFLGTDSATLKSGVGMHKSKWTVLPNENGHVLLSGHRDTVFEEMGELKIGDALSIDFEGSTYVYQIRKIFITNKEDRTVIVRKEQPLLTISTCYPFEFIGKAPHRYIIQSELIDVR
ncbi:class D sortase [Metabacillus litoralis]|uniref:class D sortase n=1 Tax=Metabacillus litoralis TaxID=152268 RepID=UPI00203F90A6|nr:class D sortase [Metabacillus litoralis]